MRNSTAVTEKLVRRIFGEFVEMPGMCLTSRQAQRLWGLDEKTCAAALGLLVSAKFLWVTDGIYRRRTEGIASFPPVHMLTLRALRPRRERAQLG